VGRDGDNEDEFCGIPGDPNGPVTRHELNTLVRRIAAAHVIPLKKDMKATSRDLHSCTVALWGTRDQPEKGVVNMIRDTKRSWRIIVVILAAIAGMLSGTIAMLAHLKSVVS
jgi:hypothetical protein